MSWPVTNFAKGTVSGGYTAGAVSITLITGHGSRFPNLFPFRATWWNSTDYPDPADDPDREIVTVTARAGDQLTVTRGAESTVASNKNLTNKTYKMIAPITAQMWTDLSTQNLSQSFRGLTVMNFPSSDFKNSRVLFNADSIVMDDGAEIQNWSNIMVDLAATAGAGALDTGTEQNNVAYELWAISDGGSNKKGVLHLAKSYFLDEVAGTGNPVGFTEDGEHALRDATARTKLAQGFRVDTSGPCEFVDVKLRKQGSPTGNYWFTIESNSGGVPSGTALGTSQSYDVALLQSTAGYVRITFRTPPNLTAGVQYHLVLQADYTISATNYLTWRADTTAATYTNGSKAAYNGTTWTADTDDDFLFNIYITINNTDLSYPTGYYQKALICPFIYNDAAGNIIGFMQKERTIHCYANAADAISSNDSWAIFATGAGPTTCTLYHIPNLCPPRPCTVYVSFGNTTSAINAQFGHITATWLTSSMGSGPGAVPGTQAFATAAANGNTISPERAVFIEYQGIMARTGGGNTFARIDKIEW